MIRQEKGWDYEKSQNCGTLFYVHARAYNSHYLRVFADEVSEVIDSAILNTEVMIYGALETSSVEDDTVVFHWITK